MDIFLYILFSSFISITTAGVLTKKHLQKKHAEDFSKLKADLLQKEQSIISENKALSEQFFSANKLKQDHQEQVLNETFLNNGRTVGVIGEELKNAQNLVSNAFSSLPNIHNCSKSTNNVTQQTKGKIMALSESVESWQGTIESLTNIQELIDDIHKKAAQIHDVSTEANLLALNASIEAARAGDFGRGFAVVAMSMRELSNKSAEATSGIATAVQATRSEVNDITHIISENISLLKEVSSDVTENFNDIENEINNISNIVEISLSEADDATQQFKNINSQVNTQLEQIVGLLANALGTVTGNIIRDVRVDSNFSDMIIIDVRSAEEFHSELGHIKNSKLICLQENFEQRLKELDKKSSYLFVCRSGGRSSRAARIALGLGFKNICNMEGGMLEYRKIHGPLQNASVKQNNMMGLNKATAEKEVTLF